MTNLIAVIAMVVTNFVTQTNLSDNAQYDSIPAPCPEGRPGCIVLHWQRGPKTADATERTEEVVTREIRTLIVDLQGEKIEKQLSDRVISSVKKTWRIAWELVPNHKLPPPPFPMWTNYNGGTITNLNPYLRTSTNGYLFLNAITNHAIIAGDNLVIKTNSEGKLVITVESSKGEERDQWTKIQ